MITFFNNQTLTLSTKIGLAAGNAATVAGSNFDDLKNIPWIGDNITVKSLFPSWIMKEYADDPNNIAIVPVVKNYLRWLFSLEYGYGAQLDWENIRVPLYMNEIFLEALADFYFPGANFGATPLKEILPNIRTFATKVDQNYFNIKGTPTAIKYLICSLLGFNFDDIYVTQGTYAIIEIGVATAQLNNLMTFDLFLREYVVPAGVVISYKSF